MSRTSPPFHGILLVDKPAGITSAAVVHEVKRRLRGPKVGHLGTLDPFATGLLPLAIGEGAKIVSFLNQEEKAYQGIITLGRATDTLDATGETTETAPLPALGPQALEDVRPRFEGEIDQIPPMFSAIKRSGVPLYKLARRGVAVDLEPRRVRILSLSLRQVAAGDLEIDVRCSKGTYVRSLARDIARALGTVGHLSSLRRTSFGRFEVSMALPLDAVSLSPPPPILGLREALSNLRELEAGIELVARLRHGQQAGLATLPVPKSSEHAKVIDPQGALVAIVGELHSAWRILRIIG